MKKYSVLFLALLLAFISCKQKTNSSKIDSNDSQTIENLSVLCEVWGFLKYYHPAVTEGKYDWDAELFKIMPSVIESRSNTERNKILKGWIESLGDVKADENPLKIDSANIKLYPDLDWIEDKAMLGDDVVNLLSKIKYAERGDSCYYIGWVKEAGNPIFKNEKTYEDTTFPDTEYRLLALFRYWNIIQYYFPYRYLIDDNWHDVLIEFIPQLIDAKDELEYKLALQRLIVRVKDTHAGIYEKIIEDYKGQRIAPYEITFIENEAVVTDLYRPINIKGNIQKGDIIKKINSEPIDSTIKRMLPYTSGSNYVVQLRNIAYNLLRTNEKKLAIEYERDNVSFTDSIFCPLVKDVGITNIMQKYKPLIEKLDDITYLYLGSTIGGTVPAKVEKKGLIIDLRCYPSSDKIKGYWEYDYLYPDSTAFVKSTSGSTKLPGMFSFSEPIKTGKSNPDYYKGKKVILINELSQSHAEFMAMKYRCTPNTIVIGSTTAAADGNVSLFSLPGGVKTCITGLGVYYPDGRETQRVGIIPDIEVKPTIKGIREGRDEILEKAIELINGK